MITPPISTYTSDKRLRAIFDLVVGMQELDMFLDDRVRVFVSILYPKAVSCETCLGWKGGGKTAPRSQEGGKADGHTRAEDEAPQPLRVERGVSGHTGSSCGL